MGNVKKILFINDVHTVGGATMALKEIVVALKEIGIEPIVSTSVKDDFNQFLDAKGIINIADSHLGAMDVSLPKSIKRPLQYEKRRMLYILKRYKALKILESQINLKEIDIIHTNSSRNDIGCLLHEKYQIPHIMHVREFGTEDFDCWIYKRNYYKYLNKQCNAILAVSNAVRDSWIKKGINEKLIRTVYDGVDFSSFQIKKNYDIDIRNLRLVITGGVCNAKGQHLAIEAINLLPKNIKKNITLDIIGWQDEKYMVLLNKLVNEYGLMEQVHFMGSRTDINKILCSYDIGLMCSRMEGFGRATAEYMYVGLGVIAADTGASPELIKQEENGLIYARNDAQELSNKILLYYNHPDLIERYGKKAHEDACAKYSLEKNLVEILNIYETVFSITF